MVRGLAIFREYFPHNHSRRNQYHPDMPYKEYIYNMRYRAYYTNIPYPN